MRYLREYRDPALIRELADRVHGIAEREYRVMEVCGGQTHTIMRYGLDQCLSPNVTFLHGPGCPVCVTPVATIDRAQHLALRPGTVVCSFGDMMRVPGSRRSLSEVKSAGGNVVTLYSPLDTLTIALKNPESQVVLFAIGFETTAPLTALAVLRAKELGLDNFSVLCAHVLIPPAIDAVLGMPFMKVDALLAPGHVCTISGTAEYESLSAKHKMPIVVTGFEPVDMLQGVHRAVEMLRDGSVGVSNQYGRAVSADGNREARRMVESVFRVGDREWRGLGVIPRSGLEIAPEFHMYDAEWRFPNEQPQLATEASAPCGDVLIGRIRPPECEFFGVRCTPEQPVGAPMVSAEGACAAHFHSRTITDRQAEDQYQTNED
jgi:hydrogenase expression/formation protein HypD